MKSTALFWEPKMGPKWVPDRIFDARALRKPLGSLLQRTSTLLEPTKIILDGSGPVQEAADSVPGDRGGPVTSKPGGRKAPMPRALGGV